MNAFSIVTVNDSFGLFDFLQWDDMQKYGVFLRPIFPFSESLFAVSILFVGEKRYSLGHKIIIFMNCVLAFFIVLAILPPFTDSIRELWDPLFMLYAVILAAITLKESISGNVGGWTYFLGQASFLGCVLLYLSSLTGIIEYSALTPFYLLFGLVAEISLMSLTLASRVLFMRESKLENEIKIKLQAENETNLKYLLRVIHHDINNALHIILNASYLAQNKNPENKMLEKVVYAGKIIQDLIQSVKKYESTLENKDDLYLEPISMVRLFEKLDLLFADKAKEKGVDLKIVTGTDVKVLANESMMLNEVLANFLSNAIKFTPSGNSVIVFWKEYDDAVTISIEDQGVGMPKDFLEAILAKDDKLNLSQKGTDGEIGSGYGILIALKTVKNFMGKIRIQSFAKQDNPIHYGTKVHIDLRKM